MAQVHRIQDASGVISADENGNALHVAAYTVPSDGAAGYAKGCIFQDLDASAGSQFYINEGSNTSADFNKVISVGTAQTNTANNTFSGTNTFDDLIETDFNPYTRVWVRTDFTQPLTKLSVLSASYVNSVRSFNQDWLVSGSGAAAVAGFTGAANSAGGVALNHSSASSTFVFMKPSRNGRLAKINWSTSKAPRFRAVIKTGASITAQKIVIGLYSGSVRPARFINGTNTKNRVEVYFDQVGDSRWRGNAIASTTASSSASLGIVVAASTIYDIEIRVSTARIVTMYINSALVATFTTALKANKRLVPIIGVQTEDDDETQTTLNVDMFHTLLSQDITAT